MSRRVAALTLDNLDDLPVRCRRCVFWELDPVAGERAADSDRRGLEKEAWVSARCSSGARCGKIVYVDGVAAGLRALRAARLRPARLALPDRPR